jgi:hypothetical protein
MQIHFVPALEERPVVDGSRPRPLIFVHVDTPTVPETNDRTVAEFFAHHSAMLAMLEARGERIFSFLVHVRSLEGLAPQSSNYLDALCTFLREHPFAVAPRTPQRPLLLTVSVPHEGEAEAAADVDRSHPLFAEATSKICQAFWQNARVRASQFLFVDVGTAPDSDVVDLLAHGRSSSAHPAVRLRVCDKSRRSRHGP